MSGPHVCDPIAHGFVDCLLKCGLASGDRHNVSAQEFHARDIKCLPLHIDTTHIDDTFAAETRGYSRSCHAVLPGAGFGNDAVFTHPACEKNLTQCVVDLVRASVQEILAFEIDFGALQLLC